MLVLVCVCVCVFSILIFQDGWTALMLASFNGRTDVVELLIKHNANVNARKQVRLHIHHVQDLG